MPSEEQLLEDKIVSSYARKTKHPVHFASKASLGFFRETVREERKGLLKRIKANPEAVLDEWIAYIDRVLLLPKWIDILKNGKKDKLRSRKENELYVKSRPEKYRQLVITTLDIIRREGLKVKGVRSELVKETVKELSDAIKSWKGEEVGPLPQKGLSHPELIWESLHEGVKDFCQKEASSEEDVKGIVKNVVEKAKTAMGIEPLLWVCQNQGEKGMVIGALKEGFIQQLPSQLTFKVPERREPVEGLPRPKQKKKPRKKRKKEDPFPPPIRTLKGKKSEEERTLDALIETLGDLEQKIKNGSLSKRDIKKLKGKIREIGRKLRGTSYFSKQQAQNPAQGKNAQKKEQ